MTTRSEIRSWLGDAKRRGATHMLVVVDDFSLEDYPVDIMPGEDPRTVGRRVGRMQRVMECYALHLPLEAQVQERLALHYESAPKPAPAGE